MTSRVGTRPTGTDGTDFRHREKVAMQYNQGPLLKRRIRVVFMLHFALWLLMFVRLFPELCLRFGFKTRSLVEKWPFPQSNLWEYVWCFGSLVPTVFGYLSLNKNRAGLMRIAVTGTVVFGLGSVVVGCFQNALELLEYYGTRKARHFFYGFPLIVLIYIFFSLCVQVHGFSVYFGYKLYSLWSQHSARKSR
ncbi:hypothetical protein CRM22_002759 [Opisthorchis felineus]|uniref:Uncharacterized protein n=2 Tax=Opisthorchis felineus TaxID=147828 RepID=A0A4S2M4I0_OPIFE|nr:hypothetical protein CRM22_002759 [Opisthorchis felineus]